MNNTTRGERPDIVIIGNRNAGKSSIINAITSQEIAIVSEVKGTTTDVVSKTMELLPVGPVLFTDTPGLDDRGELGEKRVSKAREEIDRADLCIIITEPESFDGVKDIISEIKTKNIPYIMVMNKADSLEDNEIEAMIKNMQDIFDCENILPVSALYKTGIEVLKEKIIKVLLKNEKKKTILEGLVKKDDLVVLVVPIDESAPKGRIILPQQQVLREILDCHGKALVVQPEELPDVVSCFKEQITLVITDSQVFGKIKDIVPDDISMTSFSILMARKKGDFTVLLDGIKALDNLKDGDRVLIAEGCTHQRQCGDIGTVKIPRWLKEYTGKDIETVFSSGRDFPQNPAEYGCIIHCGGCMLSDNEVGRRIGIAVKAGCPITNYGMFISAVNGIMDRCMDLLMEG